MLGFSSTWGEQPQTLYGTPKLSYGNDLQVRTETAKLKPLKRTFHALAVMSYAPDKVDAATESS